MKNKPVRANSHVNRFWNRFSEQNEVTLETDPVTDEPSFAIIPSQYKNGVNDPKDATRATVSPHSIGDPVVGNIFRSPVHSISKRSAEDACTNCTAVSHVYDTVSALFTLYIRNRCQECQEGRCVDTCDKDPCEGGCCTLCTGEYPGVWSIFKY